MVAQAVGLCLSAYAPWSPMRIPMDRLSPDVLESLIAEFVTREGTDYGLVTHSFEDKCAAVRRQLEEGDAAIVFDADSETCNIVTAAALVEST